MKVAQADFHVQLKADLIACLSRCSEESVATSPECKIASRVQSEAHWRLPAAGLPLAKIQNRFRECSGRFLWRVVTYVLKHQALIGAGEIFRMRLRFLSRVYVVGKAMNNDGWNTDLGQARQPRFQRGVAWIACGIAHAMPIRMYDNFHKVRIVERRSSPIIGLVVKSPGWRPQLPKQSSQFVAHFGESGAPPFGLKIVLIPKPAL